MIDYKKIINKIKQKYQKEQLSKSWGVTKLLKIKENELLIANKKLHEVKTMENFQDEKFKSIGNIKIIIKKRNEFKQT